MQYYGIIEPDEHFISFGIFIIYVSTHFVPRDVPSISTFQQITLKTVKSYSFVIVVIIILMEKRSRIIDLARSVISIRSSIHPLHPSVDRSSFVFMQSYCQYRWLRRCVCNHLHLYTICCSIKHNFHLTDLSSASSSPGRNQNSQELLLSHQIPQAPRSDG